MNNHVHVHVCTRRLIPVSCDFALVENLWVLINFIDARYNLEHMDEIHENIDKFIMQFMFFMLLLHFTMFMSFMLYIVPLAE